MGKVARLAPEPTRVITNLAKGHVLSLYCPHCNKEVKFIGFGIKQCSNKECKKRYNLNEEKI